MKITDSLKQHMTNSPGKDRVWVNADGEWCNFKHRLYPTELSRAEILGAKGAKETTPPVKEKTEAPVDMIQDKETPAITPVVKGPIKPSGKGNGKK